ncbi:MAG: bis(5'-nucleosyl)-tetraphosphatase (symmetrical) YqeK [Alkalispirochaeta sp.]
MSTSIHISSISDAILAILPQRVSPARLTHIYGVVETAVYLAQRFGVEHERVRLAAVAHDMDRDLTPGQGFALAADWGVALSATARVHPSLIHGPLSAERLRRSYGVTDQDVIQAVRHHTLGDPSFGPVGLILYVADFWEPGRAYLSNEEREKILSLESVQEMVRATIVRAQERFGRVAPVTEALLHQVSEG